MSNLPDNVTVFTSHAVKLMFSIIRNKNITQEEYVVWADRLVNFVSEEGLGFMAQEHAQVETHCGTYNGVQYPKPSSMCALSIMRSGDILLKGVKRACPGIGVAKILIQRDEEDPEKRPKLFYEKMPADIAQRKVMVVDPMLATGGSAGMAIDVLKSKGVPEDQIVFLNLVSCPEGLKALSTRFPKLRIFTAEVDEGLNENKFIVPGLGDFGDRYYGT